MELSYIVNSVEVSKLPTQNDACFLASQLPFLKRNYLQYTRGIIYDFRQVSINGTQLGDDADIHYALMYSMMSNKIHLYTIITGYGSVCLQADSVDGEWQLVMDGSNPLKLLEYPDEWTSEQGFDTTHPLSLGSIAYNSYNHAQDGYYRGWCNLIKDNKNCSAFCKSQDGLEWFGYTLCEYDESITSIMPTNRYIMGAYFDAVEQKYYAVLNGLLEGAKGKASPLFIKSDDGIHWTKQGMLPFMYRNSTTTEFDGSCCQKVGNLILVGISRYDYTEGAHIKNPVWCYSADNGVTWNVWNIPFVNMRSRVVKYPNIYLTPNYIFLPYVHNNKVVCLARMEWSNNPPVTTEVANITSQNVASDGFFCNQEGGKKIIVTIDATASALCSVDFDVYPVVAYGNRRYDESWAKGASCHKVELSLSSGRNIKTFAIDNLPSLWNFSLTCKMADCTLTNINVEYV